jgi:hypothetical protein
LNLFLLWLKDNTGNPYTKPHKIYKEISTGSKHQHAIQRPSENWRTSSHSAGNLSAHGSRWRTINAVKVGSGRGKPNSGEGNHPGGQFSRTEDTPSEKLKSGLRKLLQGQLKSRKGSASGSELTRSVEAKIQQEERGLAACCSG